jgi:hypothetical protein
VLVLYAFSHLCQKRPVILPNHDLSLGRLLQNVIISLSPILYFSLFEFFFASEFPIVNVQKSGHQVTIIPSIKMSQSSARIYGGNDSVLFPFKNKIKSIVSAMIFVIVKTMDRYDDDNAE